MNIHQQTQVIDLGVNIDHVATLRNASAGNGPDPLQAALLAEEAGADCITLHLREDRRHIKVTDVEQIRPKLLTRMNLKAAATNEMLDIACRIKPQEICLVPERREEMTTEGGLDVALDFAQIQAAVRQLQAAGIRVSLFVDADEQQIQASAEAGVDVIEIHTGRFAETSSSLLQAQELERIKKAVIIGIRHGLTVRAGQGLHYGNTAAIAAINGISELNIGHAIVAQALFTGWQKAVSDMKALVVRARLQASD